MPIIPFSVVVLGGGRCIVQDIILHPISQLSHNHYPCRLICTLTKAIRVGAEFSTYRLRTSDEQS
jgi:hypothetical protein